MNKKLYLKLLLWGFIPSGLLGLLVGVWILNIALTSAGQVPLWETILGPLAMFAVTTLAVEVVVSLLVTPSLFVKIKE